MLSRPGRSDNLDLPRTVAELANVIGRDKALLLAGTCRGSIYVPKKLREDHRLVQLLGDASAKALVKEFGGILLYVAKCAKLRADWRNQAVRKWAAQGVPHEALADLAGLTTRHIANILGEIQPQESVARTGQ